MNKAQLQPGSHVFCPAGFGFIQQVGDLSDPSAEIQVLILSDQAPFALSFRADQLLICQEEQHNKPQTKQPSAANEDIASDAVTAPSAKAPSLSHAI